MLLASYLTRPTRVGKASQRLISEREVLQLGGA